MERVCIRIAGSGMTDAQRRLLRVALPRLVRKHVSGWFVSIRVEDDATEHRAEYDVYSVESGREAVQLVYWVEDRMNELLAGKTLLPLKEQRVVERAIIMVRPESMPTGKVKQPH